MICLSPGQVTEGTGGAWQALPSPAFPIFYWEQSGEFESP